MSDPEPPPAKSNRRTTRYDPEVQIYDNDEDIAGDLNGVTSAEVVVADEDGSNAMRILVPQTQLLSVTVIGE